MAIATQFMYSGLMNDNSGNDSLDGAVSKIADDGLAKYLGDADLSRAMADYLYHELAIPRGIGKLLVRGMAQLTEWAAKKGGVFASDVVKNRLRHLPYYKKLEKNLDKFAAHLKGEIKTIADKSHPPHDAAFVRSLTESLKDSLEALASKKDLRNAVGTLIKRLAPQPKLFLSLSEDENSGLNRFFYGARKVPLIGRKDEMMRLEGFLDHDAPFRWWLVCGSAGFGKSRLALDFCLKRGGSWRVGFLPYEHSIRDIDNWIPDEPTLMVADYASGHERSQELGQSIRNLSNRADQFPFPVRLLLLERDAGDWWLDKLRGSGHSERGQTDKDRHDTHMTLSGLSDDGTRRVMQTLGLTTQQAAKLLPVLREMDPEGRPLFAALMADAVVNGKRRTQFWLAKEDLIKEVLGREEERFWVPAGITENDKKLLALATMCGGIKLTDLNDLSQGKDLLADFDAGRYRILSGRDATERLAPLEPDILGELFTLNRLDPTSVLDKRLESMRDLAWRLDPFGMAVFLDRTAQDFPRHEAFLPLATLPADVNEPTAILWSMAAVNLINYLAASDHDAARGWYGEIKALAAAHPDEPALREQQAKAAFNLCLTYMETKNEAEANRAAEDVFRLADENPDLPVCQEIVRHLTAIFDQAKKK